MSPTWLPVPFCHTIKLLFFPALQVSSDPTCSFCPSTIILQFMLRPFPTSIQVSHFDCPALLPLHAFTYPNFLFLYHLLDPCLPLTCISSFCFLFFCLGTQKLRTVLCPWTALYKNMICCIFHAFAPLASAFYLLSVF